MGKQQLGTILLKSVFYTLQVGVNQTSVIHNVRFGQRVEHTDIRVNLGNF